MIVFI